MLQECYRGVTVLVNGCNMGVTTRVLEIIYGGVTGVILGYNIHKIEMKKFNPFL